MKMVDIFPVADSGPYCQYTVSYLKKMKEDNFFIKNKCRPALWDIQVPGRSCELLIALNTHLESGPGDDESVQFLIS